MASRGSRCRIRPCRFNYVAAKLASGDSARKSAGSKARKLTRDGGGRASRLQVDAMQTPLNERPLFRIRISARPQQAPWPRIATRRRRPDSRTRCRSRRSTATWMRLKEFRSDANLETRHSSTGQAEQRVGLRRGASLRDGAPPFIPDADGFASARRPGEPAATAGAQPTALRAAGAAGDGARASFIDV